MEIKQPKGGKQFQQEAKNYVINMMSNARTLHRKNGCYYGKFIQKYYDFDTEQEVRENNISYKKCKNCFKGEK